MSKQTSLNRNKYRWWNLLGFIVAIALNTLANTLPINGKTTGELSSANANLFVPAGFTFSIWGVIYVLLLFFILLQFIQIKNHIQNIKLSNTLGYWFFTNCIGNAMWILAWHFELIGLSVIIMLSLLATLIIMFQILKKRKSDHPNAERWAIALPISIYFAWICVATIANITAYLVHLKWSAWGLNETSWTIIMIGVVVAITIFILSKFKDFAFGLVIIWALFGIFYKQYFSGVSLIGYAAMSALALISIASIYSFVKSGKRSY